MSVAQLIREEAKQRLKDGQIDNMAQFFQWQKAADFVEQNYRHEPSISLDSLAQALRAHNTRGHDVPEWNDVESQVKDLWRERAQWVSDYLDKGGMT